MTGPSLRVAYADSPYRGCCALYGHHHPDGLCWDDAETHRLLVERLNRVYPDGWALSCKSNAAELADFIAWAGAGVRISAWVKPFAIFKPGVNPAYTWEPVLWKGGRAKRSRQEPTVKDHAIEDAALVESVTLKKGLTGAKPARFADWVFDLLGLQAGDTLDDLFPGTGIIGERWRARALAPATRQGVLVDG